MHINLRRPIRVDGRAVARLRLTMPDAATAASIVAEPGHARAFARCLMAVTGLHEAAVRQLDLRDGFAILEKIKVAAGGNA